MSVVRAPSGWNIEQLKKRKRQQFVRGQRVLPTPVPQKSWRSSSAPPQAAIADKDPNAADLEVERVRAERERRWKESEERKKREAREERERERTRKLARGSGRLTQWFGESAAEPPRVRHDAAPVTAFSKKTIVILDDDDDEADEDYDSAFRDMAPRVQPRAHVGCCNALECRDPEHDHHLDWTVMGDAHRAAGPAPSNGRAARLDMVPDPMTLSHFPLTQSTGTQARVHPRDDTQLRTAMSSAPMDVIAMMIACARVHLTEAVNLRETYARDVDHIKRMIGAELTDVYAAEVVDRRAIDELEGARRDALQTKRARFVNTLRVLTLHMRRAVVNILADCDVQQPKGVPMAALVDALERVMTSYFPDCDEREFAVAVNMALQGQIGDELDDQIDRVHASYFSKPSDDADMPPPPAQPTATPQHLPEDREGAVLLADLRRPGDASAAKRARVEEPVYDDEGALYYPCTAQSKLAPGLTPCTAIALHVARMLVYYCGQMHANMVDENLGSMFNDRVLLTGIENYRLWYDKLGEHDRIMRSMQTIDEAIATLGGAEQCLRGLETRDYYGTVFEHVDVDANDELAGAGVMRSVEALVDALQHSDAAAKRRQAVFCVFTSGCEAFVFGTANGDSWWVFDSHDLDGNGRSVAGKFADAAALKRYLTQRRYRDQGQALDFSAVAISHKPK